MISDGRPDPAGVLRMAVRTVSAHHGQLRKGADLPYAVHPLRVAATVLEFDPPAGADLEVCVMAALLHDVVEDAGWTDADVARVAGDEVAHVVGELTQDKSLPKAERKKGMIEKAEAMSPAARYVKLADRLDNVCEMERLGRTFIERYVLETRALLNVLTGTCPALEAAIAKEIARHDVEA